MSTVDFIVVGSGSGGSAVARRLFEAGASVTVIEAGPDPKGAPEIEDPSRWFGLQGGDWDWGHAYQPAAELRGRVVPIPRGKALGGSSATNAMMWYRGTPRDYDRWAETAPGWSFAECLPAFKRAEDWEGGADDLRGAGGPLRLTRGNQTHPLTEAMLAGGEAMGLPHLADVNGPEPEGVGLASFNIAEGRRWTSADGYLRPLIGQPGFALLTGARVAEILFDGDRAVGVAYVVNGARHELRAERGVVLGAGAFETPRLLMLSGIGPEAELARLGITTRVAAEGIGQNLQDHPLVRAINVRLKAPFGPLSGNGGGTLTIWKSAPDLAEPDVLAFPIQTRSAVPSVVERYGLEGDHFAIGVGAMRSWSRGFMQLTGTGLDDPLHIVPNLLSDPRDLKALTSAVESLLDMVSGPEFAGLFAGFGAPEKRTRGPETEDFIRTACSTFFHVSGTARMGADADAPVTETLAVRGTRGLWVADASVIPVIPACHTHAPVTMIGERAATFILEAS